MTTKKSQLDSLLELHADLRGDVFLPGITADHCRQYGLNAKSLPQLLGQARAGGFLIMRTAQVGTLTTKGRARVQRLRGGK